MRALSRTFVALAILALGSVGAPATVHAEDAAAEALFDEARTLIAAGRWADACPKLAASLKLDPTANGTRLNLARCQAKIGQVASAWSTARDSLAVARRAGDTKRAAAAEEIIVEVEPRCPKLIVRVPATARAPGLVVARDGSTIEAAAFDVPLPVDPGEHTIRASAPGKTAWSRTIHLDLARVQTLDVPPLTPLPAASGRAAADEGSSAARAPDRPVAAGATSPSDGARVTSFALLGTGIAAVAVGTVFGALASGSWIDAESRCNADYVCDPAGHDAAERASTQATVATVGLIAGGALIVGGILVRVFGTSSRATASRSGPWFGGAF